MSEKPKGTLKKRDTYYKRISARSYERAYELADGLGGSKYDLYVIEANLDYAYDGHVELLIFGWEHDNTREIYDI